MRFSYPEEAAEEKGSNPDKFFQLASTAESNEK